jgi:hypothetical protein
MVKSSDNNKLKMEPVNMFSSTTEKYSKKEVPKRNTHTHTHTLRYSFCGSPERDKWWLAVYTVHGG